MKKTWIHVALILLLVFSFVLASCTPQDTGNDNVPGGGGGVPPIEDNYVDYDGNKPSGGDQFDFPGNYSAPELTINGLQDDEQWATAKTIATFGHGNAATAKVFRGEKALFFFVEVADTILATEGNTNDDAVTRSDSVEIYIDSLADGGSKPQSDDYQINLGIHGKTRIMQGSGSGWGGWNGLIDYEVTLNGTLNDSFDANDVGYAVEVMIPYSQIGIEKDDIIAIAFGQVDKVGPGASATVDWDWYPWTVLGILVEPQTPNNYLLLDKDNNVVWRDDVEKPDADIAGYVVDYVTQQPIAGVTVRVEGEEQIASVVTDDQGYFIFEKVDSNKNYTVLLEKDGYFGNSQVYSRAELRESNGGRVLKNITLRDKESVAKTTISGTVKNLIDGVVEGATVEVVGTDLTATTAVDGTFAIQGVPAEEDVTLVVKKSFYGDSTTVITADRLTQGDVSQVGDVNLNRPYAQTGMFAGLTPQHANNFMQISRSLTGIEFLMSGTRLFTGKVEIYLDTKECAPSREQDTNAWRFDLFADGVVVVDNFAAEGNGTAEGLQYQVYSNDSTGYSAKLFIPYSYLDITPLEVFGISLGQAPEGANWDGWGYNGQFVAPETPATYMRMSATNELYVHNSNTSMVTLTGNVGMAGVTITAGGVKTSSASDGSWSVKVPYTTEQITITYSIKGYVSQTYTVPANTFTSGVYSHTVPSVTLEQQKVIIGGTLVDSETNAPIVGATVTIVGTELSATTDAEGKYVIENVGTFDDVTLKIEADNYATQEKSLTALELSASESHVVDAQLVSSNQIKYVTLTGKVTNVNGPVVGANVTVVGNSALTAVTGEDGSFTIDDFAGVDCTIAIEKAGYVTNQVTFKASDLAQDAVSHAIADQDMLLDYAKLHGLIADKADTFAAFQGYVTRSQTGFEFKFVGSRAFTGRIELFVDTKTSAGDNARDTSDYLFNLNADGTMSIVNWGEGAKNEAIPTTMKLTVTGANTSAPTVEFTLPYAFFGQIDANAGITATEVIGISAGQWMGSDWDGWDNFALWGANNSAFVKPEMPTDYIRIGAHNEIYSHVNNDTLNLNEYQIHFGTGYNCENNPVGATPANATLADNFYAKVSARNENGVTFDFITTGDFGVSGTEKEMVLIYFDKGATVNGWDSVDYLIKVASDGTVYGSNSAWWSASDEYKIGEVTITRSNGVTTFSLTVAYATIGVTADEIFGVAMREASHNAGNHTLCDPWWDCYFNKGTDIGYPAAGIDAANSDQYIRVSADGTLYRAVNNNAQ